MINIKKITEFILDDIATFFPYFFVFYCVVLIFSFIFESWISFFRWPILQISVLILGFLGLFSKNVEKNYVKPALVGIILYYFLERGVGIIDFIVLSYALISIIFIINGRIAALVAFTLFALCLLFLILKRSDLSEVFAVYTYYFLTIAVTIRFREFLSQKRDVWEKTVN